MLHWVISGLRCNQSSVVCERAAYANETIANTLARKYLRARYLLIARALAQIRDALIKSVIKIIMSDSLITKDLLIRKNWLRLAGHLDQVVALSATTTVSRRSRYADIECDYAFIFIHALAFREFASRNALIPCTVNFNEIRQSNEARPTSSWFIRGMHFYSALYTAIYAVQNDNMR
jgi:hypothetical protein